MEWKKATGRGDGQEVVPTGGSASEIEAKLNQEREERREAEVEGTAKITPWRKRRQCTHAGERLRVGV